MFDDGDSDGGGGGGGGGNGGNGMNTPPTHRNTTSSRGSGNSNDEPRIAVYLGMVAEHTSLLLFYVQHNNYSSLCEHFDIRMIRFSVNYMPVKQLIEGRT